MATKSITKITEMGERLSHVRHAIDTAEALYEESVKALKVERDQLNADLLESLQGVGLTSIKTSGGDSFVRASRTAFGFATPIALERVAKDMSCMRPDSTMLKQKLAELERKGQPLPAGVTTEKVEYISVRKAKPKAEVSA